MKILVTGGAGFIGSHIVDLLIEQGNQVVVIDNLSTGKAENVNKDAIFYQMDLLDQRLSQILLIERPEVVIHQAAQTQVPRSIEDPNFDANTNILGTIRLLEACRESRVRKVIFASTAAVYGNPKYLPIDERHPIRPLSGYGVGKFAAEQYLYVYHQLYGLEYTVLRYANVYGLRQDAKGEGGVISIFIDRVAQEKPISIYGDGEQTRDYIYVEDVARANVAAIHRGNQEVFNIGTGVKTSINQLVELLVQITGKPIVKDYKAERSGDIKESSFDHRKAQTMLRWEPKTALLEGLRKTYEAKVEKKIIK